MIALEEVDRILSQCVEELDKYGHVRAHETIRDAREFRNKLREDAQALPRWEASALAEDLRALADAADDVMSVSDPSDPFIIILKSAVKRSRAILLRVGSDSGET